MESGGRILLIEDDEPFRRLIRIMLTGAGFDVEEAANGEIGLVCYRQHRSDVVLTDILMKDGEGLEAIQALKAIDPDVKIIAMSVAGEGPTGYLRTALSFGARRTLRKPFSRAELLATLADVFAR